MKEYLEILKNVMIILCLIATMITAGKTAKMKDELSAKLNALYEITETAIDVDLNYIMKEYEKYKKEHAE